MFFHIYFNYVSFGQKVQDFSYARQAAQNYVFILADRKQFMARKNRIFNLNRTYRKKSS